MRPDLEKVAERVRSRLCGACTLQETVCQGRPPQRCVLFDLFPLVVQAIMASEGGELADYRQAVRENVCPVCTEAALDLSCAWREQLLCALDLYLAEVVAVVREVAQREADPRLAAR